MLAKYNMRSKDLSSIYSFLMIIQFCFIFTCSGEAAAQTMVRSFAYSTQSDYQKSLFDGFIDSMFRDGTSLDQVMGDRASIRSTTRLALALLFRDEREDRIHAVRILEWILKQQHLDENAEIYGAWKTTIKNDRLDHNWREFVGCDLIIVYHHYKDLLPDDLLEKIKTALTHAALGALRRDVTPHYTNISVMSAFLMNYVGTTFDIPALSEAGMSKAQDINALFQAHGTFSEFNSPTYDGVSMVGFALWRALGPGQMKTMGDNLEQSLWNEVASHYNPTLKNMLGPFIRAYGMDMTKYVSITGLWIALAVDDETLAPMPKTKGAKYFEISNIAPIMHLGLSIPVDAVQALKNSSEPRFLNQQIFNNTFAGDKIKQVTMLLNQYWMMGGLQGNRRSWRQICTGTVHWRGNEAETEWMLIPGNGLADVSVSNTSMQIYTVEWISKESSEKELKIYVYSKEISEEAFARKKWKLGKMQFDIKTDLDFKYKEVDEPSSKNTSTSISEYYPTVAEITLIIPGDWDVEKPVLEISPIYLH